VEERVVLSSSRRKYLGAGFTAAVLTCAGVTALRSAAGGMPGERRKANGILVAFKGSAPIAARVGVLSRLSLRRDRRDDSPHFARLQLDPARSGAGLKAALAALRSDASVRVAEPNYTVQATAVPNDPQFSRLWALSNTGQTGGTPDADIDATEAWNVSTGSSVVVAVIDTGVDYDHPDLQENILRDSAGRVIGHDFSSGDSDPMDENGHGTHVAGTIGARGNNGVGVTGVCQSVKIMPVRFLNRNGDGDTAGAIQAIDFARQHGAKIMNNSWGGGGYEQLLKEAIDRARAAGILFVAAAGNESSDNDEVDAYPGGYNRESDNVLAITSSPWRRQTTGTSCPAFRTMENARWISRPRVRRS
jgi:subtilisin family serine protease